MGKTEVTDPQERARRRQAARGGGERHARRILFAAVLVPLLLTLTGTGWLVWQTHRMRETAEWARESEQVTDLANELFEALLDQETGVRGFLLTEDRAYLAPYEHARPGATIDVLEARLADAPRRLALLSALRREHAAWEALARAAIDAPEAGRRGDAMAARKAIMDRLRALIAAFMEVQDRRRAAQYAAFARESLLSTVGAVAFFVALGGAAAWSTHRKLRLIDEAFAAERAAAREKDAFLATLSHELRTPLVPILGWVRLLRTRRLSPEAHDHALAVIERNARTEAQLVEDVLDVARIAAGKMTIEREAVDVGTVVREAVEVVRLAAEEKGVALEVRVAPDVAAVCGDAQRLQQVVWNLLNNAVKFTPRGGHVQISVSRSASRIRVRVADDGEGITKEALGHLFERFWQVDSSPTRRHAGLGLGLAIVKDVVTLHGGQVSAASEGPGHGAVFTVTLPIAAVGPGGGADAPAQAASAPPLRGRRVLVVDNDASARDLLAAALGAHGAEVHVAASASEALHALAQANIDVLVSDLGMPGLSGYDLIGALRLSQPHGRLPALAVSAYVGADDVRRALDAGFQAHLGKPVDVDGLVRTVARLCGPEGPP